MKEESITIESIRLATLLELEQLLREAENEDIWAFTLVNETLRLIPYRQAVIVKHPGNHARISHVSGVSSIDKNAPVVRWLQAFARDQLHDRLIVGDIDQVSAQHHDGWSEWGTPHWLYLPLSWPTPEANPECGLLLLREQPVNDAELPLLERLGAAAAHALHSLRGGRRSASAKPLTSRLIALGLVCALAASFIIPVRQSVLAPAEVATHQPHVVTSPQDGVVASVHVTPNQMVKRGDRLFTLDDTLPRNQLAVAEKALAVAESQHRQAVQGAFVDASRKSDVAVLQARIEKTRAEREQARELLDRSVVRAERDGIAIFPDVTELLGRPIQVGERVMELADPEAANLVAWVAVADAIELQPGAPVHFYLNTSPDAPLEASLTHAAYQSAQSPSGILSFEIRAAFGNDTALPRIGLRGTARVVGDEVSLFRYLMRRPLSVARPWLGF